MIADLPDPYGAAACVVCGGRRGVHMCQVSAQPHLGAAVVGSMCVSGVCLRLQQRAMPCIRACWLQRTCLQSAAALERRARPGGAAHCLAPTQLPGSCLSGRVQVRCLQAEGPVQVLWAAALVAGPAPQRGPLAGLPGLQLLPVRSRSRFALAGTPAAPP